MRSTFDVLSEVYKVINVAGIADEITGQVYIGPEPNNDQKENYTVGTLTNAGGYVQNGIINVNSHALGSKNGRPDLATLKRMHEKLIVLFDNVTLGGPPGPTVHIEIDDEKGPFEDQENPGKWFHNMRLNFVTL